MLKPSYTKSFASGSPMTDEPGSSSTQAQLTPERGITSYENDDLGEPSNCTHQVVRKCSIVYTLNETLCDSSALAYFIQFMETIGQLNLIKFWLHVESFKASAANLRSNDEALLSMVRNDATNIYGKYICEDAPCSIGITNNLRKDLINRICVKDGIIKLDCFSGAQDFVRNVMETRYCGVFVFFRYFPEFLSSIYYLKHQLDAYSSGALRIADVLKSEKLMCALIEFLDGEGCRKLIEFVIAADTFAQQMSLHPDNEQLMEDALIIYEKYFSMQATDPLKFGAKIRIQVESDICTESGRPSPDCFRAPRRIAVSILEQNYLRPFLASPPFMKFLYELMRQIDSNIDLPNPNRRKRFGINSERSSETSLSFSFLDNQPRPIPPGKNGFGNGTGLPMGSNEDDETASQADSISLFGHGSNFRRNAGGMSLATVDDYGHYRPMYDNTYSSVEDLTSTTKKIKNTLDRYLHQSLTKEAEVADHVAQLIIADIQNMVSAASSQKHEQLT
uniref:RGS domain-containing protein n=1 Tax=Syphacia muris TaxID=451379 RepID=A0A158R4H9_9BILA